MIQVRKHLELFSNKANKRIMVFSSVVWSFIFSALPAYAAPSVADSKIAKGTEKLIQDLTTWLMVLAPVVAGLLIIYFCIRRSAAMKWIRKNGITE